MLISTGMTLPRWDSVAALYCLQKSMMLTPCGPSAVPTGGAGVAAPAFSWTLTIAASFFLGGMPHPFVPVWLWPRLPLEAGYAAAGTSTAALGPLVPPLARGGIQILEAWLDDSSTGVSRPKIETSTMSFCASALISMTVAGSVANGPSMTGAGAPAAGAAGAAAGA